MKRPQMIGQNALSRLMGSAQAAWERREFDQCFEMLERAGRMDPGNWRVQLQMGQMYGLRYRYEEAEKHLEKAVAVAPNKAEALAAAAGVSVDFVRHEVGERYYKRALEQKEVKAETVAGLAELYERLRRMEEAGQLVERALQLNGQCGAALLVKARMARQGGKLEEAEKEAREVLKSGDRHTRVKGYYELGAILDKGGRYDEAMSAWLEAKALLKPEAGPLLADHVAIAEHVKEMQASVSFELLQKWHATGAAESECRRIAYLGGHSRSGTTLLEQVLDSHPDVVSVEEATIFNDDVYTPLRRLVPPETPMLEGLDRIGIEFLAERRSCYFRMMERHAGRPIAQQMLIDKNPSITVQIPAFLRIFPELRLLIAIRDPRDVVMSCFMQPHLPISSASVGYLTIEGTVEAYARVMGVWRHLSRMVPNPWMEVKYEDAVADLESVSRKVLGFLGLSWSDNILRFHEHAMQKRIRTPSYADATRPVFRTAIGRWRPYEKYFAPHLRIIEPLLSAFKYDV